MCDSQPSIQIERTHLQVVDEFCYFGSYLTSNVRCGKEICVRLGKAHSTFNRLSNIWCSKSQQIRKHVCTSKL